MIALTPISIGELLDKISILEIKREYIRDPAKLVNVCNELRCLTEVRDRLRLMNHDSYAELYSEMYRINRELWALEDRIRELMARPTSDTEFIDTAVSIHKKNDARAFVKKAANLVFKSELIEEKSYKEST
jgi:hypothetical protein